MIPNSQTIEPDSGESYQVLFERLWALYLAQQRDLVAAVTALAETKARGVR